jgi:hypothetical protein
VQNYTFLIPIAVISVGIGIQLVLFQVFQRVAPVVEAFAHRNGLRLPSGRKVAFVLVSVLVLATLVRPLHAWYRDWESYHGFQESIAEEPNLEVMPLIEGETESIETTWRRLEFGDARWLNKDLESIGLVPRVASAIALADDGMAPYSWWSVAANRANTHRAIKRMGLRLHLEARSSAFHVSADQKTLVVYSSRTPAGFERARIFRDSERGIEVSEWYRPEKDIEPGVGAASR